MYHIDDQLDLWKAGFADHLVGGQRMQGASAGTTSFGFAHAITVNLA